MDMDPRLSSVLDAGKRELAEHFGELKKAYPESVVTADSADGLVSATVDGRCRLVELYLDQRVYRSPDSAALARAILDTVHAAAGEAGRRAGEVADHRRRGR